MFVLLGHEIPCLLVERRPFLRANLGRPSVFVNKHLPVIEERHTDFDRSASVISSRIAPSATLALKALSRDHATHNPAGQWDEWFFRFVILNRFSYKSIHHNYWSDIP